VIVLKAESKQFHWFSLVGKGDANDSIPKLERIAGDRIDNRINCCERVIVAEEARL